MKELHEKQMPAEPMVAAGDFRAGDFRAVWDSIVVLLMHHAGSE